MSAVRRRADPALRVWTGAFGDRYTARNDAAHHVADIETAFSRMLGRRRPRSVLEVGSNVGLNLLALRRLLGQRASLYAVEPNTTAYARLTTGKRIGLRRAWNCDAFDLPLSDATVDLVFTSGVLIHIPPHRLARATDEIVRVSRRYVLCIEYFSHAPEERPYRGRSGLLFKRDFGSYYLDRHSELSVVDYGFLWQRELRFYDDLNWWLLEKVARAAPKAVAADLEPAHRGRSSRSSPIS